MATDTEPTVNETAPAPAPDRDADRLAEARRLNAEIIRLCAEHAAKDREAKSAKKVMEAARHRLNNYLAGLDDDAESMPLFDRPAAARSPAEPDAWWSVPVDVLCTDHGLPWGVGAKLAEAGIDTVGELADWTDGGKVLTDVPGIGEAKAEAIGTALVGFWEVENRRKAQRVMDGAADPGPTNGEADRSISNWIEGVEAEARDAAGRAASREGEVPGA